MWIVDLQKYGRVLKKLDEPRSYLIKADRETYRRNRWHLISVPNFGTGNSDNSDEFYNPNENCIVENNFDNNASEDQTDLPYTPEELPSEETPEVGPSTRVGRQRTTPTWFKDYVV